jgi:HK97 family phage portal protein
MDSPSLNAKNKPSWSIKNAFKRINPFASRIEPEEYHQDQGGPKMTRFGLVKAAGGKFSEISGNQFVIERPGAGTHINPSKALANNRGFVYAAMNAIAREVMTIDWRLFEVDGDDHEEQPEHDALDLLDAVNDNMIGPELKYLTSASLTLTGNAYWYLEGVKSDLDKPKAIHLMPPDRVRPVLDRRTWPYQLVGYRMKLETVETVFKPYEVIHFRTPNPSDFFEGMSPVQAGAEYIDNDNYAMEFNRKFFVNGARPAGFLETEMIAETQIEALKIGFADVHEGIDNMNRIAILPKGVKWTATGANPKDMDFKNMSEDMRDRILAMFGVSRTILGTAESDTNRATAETADYVFSKRVVKPHMTLICAFLNEKLIPRYGDDLYISFIDPVPEDRAARTDEMTKAAGGVPIITQNEARDEFMGLGPVDGGDTLLAPTSMAPAGEADGTEPGAEGPQQPAKRVTKAIRGQRAANGERVAFRPPRTKLEKRAKRREEMRNSLTASIKEALEKRFSQKTKKFPATKEQDDERWKEFSEYTHAAEKEVIDTLRKINAEQKKEVLNNLPSAIAKGINPADLFDINKWISITTDAMSPIFETLFDRQARDAAVEIGKPELNPFNDTARAAVKRSVQMMSESYNQTTLTTLESHINDGLQKGESIDDITKHVEQIYEWSDNWRAERVAKTESFRTANSALKEAWQQSGVVKTVKWYTANNPCPFCQAMNGKVISIDDNFFSNGDSLTVGQGEDAQNMSFDYGDVGGPPLHPNCMCFLRPEDVSIE